MEQGEVEWGLEVVAIKWQMPSGRREVKLLGDGRLLFLELSENEPVPSAVRELAAGRQVEAIILEGYREAGWPDGKLLLSSGRILQLPTDPD